MEKFSIWKIFPTDRGGNFAKRNNVRLKFRAKISKKQKIFVLFNKNSVKCVF